MLVDLTEKHEVAQMKQQFVAMVSHDLRSPLTSLLAFLDTLYKGGYGFLTEHGSGSSRLAQQSVKRLIALINDLLDIEKVEAGRLQLRKRQLRVEHLLSRATETVQWLADQAAVSLVTKSDVYRAIGDEDQLLRVLVNLIGNAIKFSPPGSTVEILVKKQPDRLEFHVVDSGCGISASDQAIIFDRFRQTTLQSDQLQGGSGLGLAICKALIAAHDGQIGVFSELGKGSDFWFTLPNNSTIF